MFWIFWLLVFDYNKFTYPLFCWFVSSLTYSWFCISLSRIGLIYLLFMQWLTCFVKGIIRTRTLYLFIPKAIIMFNLILFGPPGSGKGNTVWKAIASYGFKHLSTGDILRVRLKTGLPWDWKPKPHGPWSAGTWCRCHRHDPDSAGTKPW